MTPTSVASLGKGPRGAWASLILGKKIVERKLSRQTINTLLPP